MHSRVVAKNYIFRADPGIKTEKCRGRNDINNIDQKKFQRWLVFTSQWLETPKK